MRILDTHSKLMQEIKEIRKRVEFIRTLPEYDELIRLEDEFDRFSEHINDKRKAKTFELVEELTTETWGPDEDERVDKLEHWLERLKNHRKKQSDLAFNRGYSYSETNVMDHIWEVFVKYGKKSDTHSEFTGASYSIGNYTMEIASGQGEYCYSIYFTTRIY